ncbi:MAG: GNAT family N-acetyltransferase [Candidatus Sericytochromatia bacterium]|nr:GNAT family N-acetyltransferase [Candidatus Sericytochromatia bacterium]
MIQSIPFSEIPLDAFPEPYHDVIALSYLQRQPESAQALAELDQTYAVYHPNTGFCLSTATTSSLEPWATWLYENRIPLIAGELGLHFKLLQTIGQVVPETAPTQVLCRYEAQDFCFQSSPLPVLAHGLTVRQADVSDLDKLFYFYKRSEGMEARSIESLKQTIKQDKLFYIQKMGKIISAALTHCETDQAALIGGVYTPPAYRGKGYGKACVHGLLAALKAEGKTPCLFYEKHNAPAKALYTGLGFVPHGEWLIAELIYQAQN